MMFIPDKPLETLRTYPKYEQEYDKLKDQIWLYRRWEYRANDQIPELARRIFNLRYKDHKGHSFTYAIERKLGNVLIQIHNYDDCPRDPNEMEQHRSIMWLAMNNLFKLVVNVEKSLKR